MTVPQAQLRSCHSFMENPPMPAMKSKLFHFAFKTTTYFPCLTPLIPLPIHFALVCSACESSSFPSFMIPFILPITLNAVPLQCVRILFFNAQYTWCVSSVVPRNTLQDAIRYARFFSSGRSVKAKYEIKEGKNMQVWNTWRQGWRNHIGRESYYNTVQWKFQPSQYKILKSESSCWGFAHLKKMS